MAAGSTRFSMGTSPHTSVEHFTSNTPIEHFTYHEMYD